jgi:uncharacterized protein (TIGR02145 family)
LTTYVFQFVLIKSNPMKKKNSFWFMPLLLLASLSIVLTGCPPPGKLIEIPTLTTTSAGSITATSATTGGNIAFDGGDNVTARGVCWGTSTGPTLASSKSSDGTGTGSFTSSITGLNPGITYYVKAYATNSAGTGYGNEITFTTSKNLSLATVTTSAVTNITATTATIGGNVTSDGNATVTERGTVVSTNPNPTTALNKFPNGTGTGSFTSNITGFTANTTYYVRAYAINSQGTAYGNEVSFKTSSTTGSTVSDNDGNSYSTVTIGTQVWMTSNLKTTKYNDGTLIPWVKGGAIWANLQTPAYCWEFNDSIKYKNTIGAYYNWRTVNTGKLCPTGWHVPTKDEYTTLQTYLGGYSVSGGKLKETGYVYWLIPNTGATNETGFSAYANGLINSAGDFFNAYVERSLLWSSTEYVYNNQGYQDNTRAWHFQLNWSDTNFDISNGYPKTSGLGVRCLKN